MGPTALLPLWRKACWGFFSPEKSWRLRPGLNPRTWVLKSSTLPLDHRSRSCWGFKMTVVPTAQYPIWPQFCQPWYSPCSGPRCSWRNATYIKHYLNTTNTCLLSKVHRTYMEFFKIYKLTLLVTLNILSFVTVIRSSCTSVQVPEMLVPVQIPVRACRRHATNYCARTCSTRKQINQQSGKHVVSFSLLNISWMCKKYSLVYQIHFNSNHKNLCLCISSFSFIPCGYQFKVATGTEY